MNPKQLYISVDVETDGPIPGEYSMLSLGAVSLTMERGILGRFSTNLLPLLGARTDPDTMQWWREHPAAWAHICTDRQHPGIAMREFIIWVVDQGTRPVCIAYPAGFDWTFLYWYLRRFAGYSPFGFSCLDIKSYASALLGLDFRDTTKKNLPKEWFADSDNHSHVAVEDAEEQALLWLHILNQRVTQ